MWPWSSAPTPEPEREPQVVVEPVAPAWSAAVAAASREQAEDPAAAADKIRAVLQQQQLGRGEQAQLRCALGFALGAGGDYAAAAAELRLGLSDAAVASHAKYVA